MLRLLFAMVSLGFAALQPESLLKKAKPGDALAKEMSHDLEMNYNKIAPFGRKIRGGGGAGGRVLNDSFLDGGKSGRFSPVEKRVVEGVFSRGKTDPTFCEKSCRFTGCGTALLERGRRQQDSFRVCAADAK